MSWAHKGCRQIKTKNVGDFLKRTKRSLVKTKIIKCLLYQMYKMFKIKKMLNPWVYCIKYDKSALKSSRLSGTQGHFSTPPLPSLEPLKGPLNIIYIITKIQLCPRTFIKDPHSSIPIIDFGCHLDVAVSNSQMPKCIFSISNLRQIIIISKEIFVLNWTLGEGNLFKLKFTIKISQKISIFKIRN